MVLAAIVALVGTDTGMVVVSAADVIAVMQ